MKIVAREEKKDAEKGEKIFSSPFSASRVCPRAVIFTRARVFRASYYPWASISFSVYMIPIMKFCTRTKISFGMKTGMTDLCWTQISPQYYVNRCNEMYGDGMNSFRNEIRPGIM